jgi:hypothetical protein
MAYVVECLSSKHETLSLIPSTVPPNKNKQVGNNFNL